jgi:hypothetical protein
MLRTDIWASAFVRRHNDLGHICVVVRKGDPIAGQIFIEVDHLNGTVSLYTRRPRPSAATARRGVPAATSTGSNQTRCASASPANMTSIRTCGSSRSSCATAIPESMWSKRSGGC